MKKYISAIIIIMILLINTSVFADADNAFTVYLDNINAKPNEEVEINISLKNNTGILAMLFELNYDSNCLSLIDVKDGGLVDGYVFGNDYSQIPFKMLWNSASDTNFKDDGVLATLKFKVLNTAPNGTTAVSLTYRPKNVYDVDLNKVDINVINGSINITNDTADTTSSGQQNNNSSHSSGSSGGKTGNGISGKINQSNTSENSNSNDTENEDYEVFLFGLSDVKESDWYYEYVKQAFEKGLMKGVSETEFAPDEKLTRAMFVTILHRMDGEPDANQSAFTDVEKDSWYEKAVAWANANGIVQGVSETEFAPNTNITREQMAAIIFRYAKYKGIDIEAVTKDTNTLSHNDVFEVSDWAKEGMHYCIAAGIISGDENGNLLPHNTATRAETATVITRIYKS